LLYKYERIRDENIFDRNLFLLKLNIEYYQKRFKSYKRQLIYIMSACRNLLVISDDPYYNNFNTVAEENRHSRQHLNESFDCDMYSTLLNPESVASIRNLLNVLSHSFLKIEKYDKDLFSRDNYYISSNILTNDSQGDEMNNQLQTSQNITVYSMPKTTVVNNMVNTIKEDKTYASKKNKGKIEMKENEDYNRFSSLPNIPSESLMERKLNPISIYEVSSSSTVSIDFNEDKERSPTQFSSTHSFHDYFNLDPSLSDNDLFLSKDKLYSNALFHSSSSMKSFRKDSSETLSSSVVDDTTNIIERKQSKIQNFPPEILVKIFRYVRIIPKDKKGKNIKDNAKNCSSSTTTSTSSSSSSLSDKNNYKGSSSTTEASTSTSNNENCGISSSEDHNNDSKSGSNAYHDVYNCIQVCRHWRYLAQKELYHTLSFSFTNIINSYLLLKIAASLEVICKSEKISPTHTIVVRVSHDGKVPDSKEWYDRKGELAFNMILRNCPNLKCKFIYYIFTLKF